MKRSDGRMMTAETRAHADDTRTPDITLLAHDYTQGHTCRGFLRDIAAICRCQNRPREALSETGNVDGPSGVVDASVGVLDDFHTYVILKPCYTL